MQWIAEESRLTAQQHSGRTSRKENIRWLQRRADGGGRRASSLFLAAALATCMSLFVIALSGCEEVAGSAVAGDGALDLSQIATVIDLTTKSLQLFKELSNTEAGTIRTDYKALGSALKTGAPEPSGDEGGSQTNNTSALSGYLEQKKAVSGLLAEMNAHSTDMQTKAYAAANALHETTENARTLFGLLNRRCNDIADEQLRSKALADVSETRNAFYSKLDVAQSALAEAEKSITHYKDLEAYLEVQLGRGLAEKDIADLDRNIQTISALNNEIQSAVDDGMGLVEAQRNTVQREPSQAQDEREQGTPAVEQAALPRQPQDIQFAASTPDAPVNDQATPSTTVFPAAMTSQVAPAPVPVPLVPPPPPASYPSAYAGGNRGALATPPNSPCICQHYAVNIPPRVLYARPRFFRPSRRARLYR